MDSFDPWYCFRTIELGVINGFSNIVFQGTSYFPPALKAEDLDIAFRKDSDFFGMNEFEPVTFTLHNDGSLDNLARQNLYGKSSRLKLGFPDLDNGIDDFETLLTGKIENIPAVAFDGVKIRVGDLRKFLSRAIPINTLNKTDYPDLNEDNVERPKPLAFGNIRGAELICLNEEETPVPTHYDFILADTETWELKNETPTVKVEGSTVTVTNFSAASGTFQLSSGLYEAGDTVTADLKGFIDSGGDFLNNATDIIKALLAQFADISYISDNYDLSGWSQAYNSAYNMAIFIDETRSITEVINDLAYSCLGFFTPKRDGKYTFLYNDLDAAAVATIYQEEILNPDDIQAEYDEQEFLTSAVCKYSEELESGNWRRARNTDYEEDVYETYVVYREREFETKIDNATDAAAYAEERMVLSQSIRPVFTVVTGLQHVQRKILDNVNVELNRLYDSWYGTVKCQIIGMRIKPAVGQIEFSLKYIEDA
jgi:hypothetical protein